MIYVSFFPLQISIYFQFLAFTRYEFPDNSVLSTGFLEPSDNYLGRTSTMSLSVHATGSVNGVAWLHNGKNGSYGLPPGTSQNGFIFRCQGVPGITTALEIAVEKQNPAEPPIVEETLTLLKTNAAYLLTKL